MAKRRRRTSRNSDDSLLKSRKRTTSTRTSRRKTKKSRKKTPTISSAVNREIWAVIYLVLGILTILSINSSLGLVGNFWMNILLPVLGWGVYLVPACFFLVSGMLFFSKKIEFSLARIFGLFLFFTSVLSIIHLSVPLENIYEFAQQGRYGGYTGFVMNFLFLEVLKIGTIGAAIIFVASALISLMLIFDFSLKSVFSFLKPAPVLENSKKSSSSEVREIAGRDHRKIIEGELVDSLPEIQIHKGILDNKKEDETIFDNGKHSDVELEQQTKLLVNDNTKPNFAPLGTGKNSSENSVDSLTDSDQNSSKELDYDWEYPKLNWLKQGDSKVKIDEKLLMGSAEKIRTKLKQFGIDVKMHEVNVGPTVIQYTLKPDEGVKLSKITGLKNDLALALAAENIRIEAPIPGKSLVGIELANTERATVHLRELLDPMIADSFEQADKLKKGKKSGEKTPRPGDSGYDSTLDPRGGGSLEFPLGRDVSGNPIIADLAEMPHLLIAGATGSGKSVATNSFLISLLYQNSPKDLKLILVDPKRVELSSYNSIPHLLTPVIVEPDKAAIALRWVVAEMTRRYKELSKNRVRNIEEFNFLVDEANVEDPESMERIPKLVVVIDELADLMMTAGKEVEGYICRIAQMARAVGIHLVIATQRPSVDVITGTIKANIPSRMAFAVSSSIDSRTILDSIGAEDLLGRGDMLYMPVGMSKPQRIQGIFISTEEIEKVTNNIKLTGDPEYNSAITSEETANTTLVGVPDSEQGSEEDSMYSDAFNLVKESRKASASYLQRRLKVGYARAARLIDLLEENGIVGPPDGSKPRKILIE